MAKRRPPAESIKEWLARPDIAATMAARRRLFELDDLMAQLPDPWRAAAKVMEDNLDIPAQIEVALAFCRWYLRDADEAARHFRETRRRRVVEHDPSGRRSDQGSNRLSFLTRRAVEQYRAKLEAVVGPPVRRPRGRPPVPPLTDEDLSTIKAYYRRRLAAYRRAHGIAGAEGLDYVLRETAQHFDITDVKKLKARLFRRHILPAPEQLP